MRTGDRCRVRRRLCRLLVRQLMAIEASIILSTDEGEDGLRNKVVLGAVPFDVCRFWRPHRIVNADDLRVVTRRSSPTGLMRAKPGHLRGLGS